MKLISCCVLLTLALEVVPLAAQQPDRSSSNYTPASLTSELRRVKTILEERGEMQALSALPASWQIETPEGSFSISSEPLRQILASRAPISEGTLNREKALEWLDHLTENLEGYPAPSGGERPQEHAAISRILARPEFAANAPPTRLELFYRRVINQIRDLLERILSFAALHPSGSTILFWVVVAGGVGIIGTCLLRLWARANQTLALAVPAPTPQVRTWEEWIRASRAAAERGDSREAIRLAYWAGIARLQAVRVLPMHTSQTPREYLRFLSHPRPGGTPAPAVFQESLSGLTSCLERFWYAGGTAGPDDVGESLRHLEALGCRVD